MVIPWGVSLSPGVGQGFIPQVLVTDVLWRPFGVFCTISFFIYIFIFPLKKMRFRDLGFVFVPNFDLCTSTLFLMARHTSLSAKTIVTSTMYDLIYNVKN